MARPVELTEASLSSLRGLVLRSDAELSLSFEQVCRFGDLSGDRQWIHVDRERISRESPFMKPIAQGFLTLSLLPQFFRSAVAVGSDCVVLNVGIKAVRFLAPVHCDTPLRADFTLESWKEAKNSMELTWTACIYAKGQMAPSCIAAWTLRFVSPSITKAASTQND